MNIKANKLKNGSISFLINLNGVTKKIATASRWSNKGWSVDRLRLDGSWHSSEAFYFSESYDSYVECWVENLLDLDQDAKIQW